MIYDHEFHRLLKDVYGIVERMFMMCIIFTGITLVEVHVITCSSLVRLVGHLDFKIASHASGTSKKCWSRVLLEMMCLSFVPCATVSKVKPLE